MNAYTMHIPCRGHSFWSFRLRQLAFLGSAVVHQDLPCHEFWHALLRPYEHYLPVSRNLYQLGKGINPRRRPRLSFARFSRSYPTLS